MPIEIGRLRYISKCEFSMAKKLFVGNLSFRVTSESLNEAFSKAGTVISATVITDRATGRSRGFGFVELDDADAEKAINMWNGQELDGRRLFVSVARPEGERRRRGEFSS